MKALQLCLAGFVVVCCAVGCSSSNEQARPDTVKPELTADKTPVVETPVVKTPETTTDAKPQACQAPMKRGPCKALFKRYYFDANSGACTQFNWGGCDPSPNNFTSLKECQVKCE